MALYKYTYYYYYYNNNNDNRQSQNKRHHNNPVRTACAAVQHYNAPIHITMHNTQTQFFYSTPANFTISDVPTSRSGEGNDQNTSITLNTDSEVVG